MSGARIDLVDAVEVVAALEFLCDWFDTDPVRLDQSLRTFATEHYQLGDLRADLAAIAARLGDARDTAIDRIGGSR